jgi:aquaporin Z
MAGVLLVEVLGTALLVAVFLATTASRNPARAAAPFAVGLTTAILLQLGQTLGNVPFNPARATASAIFSGPDALGQLWLFWVAPVVGAAIAGLVFRGFAQNTAQTTAQADAALTDADAGDADFGDAELADGVDDGQRVGTGHRGNGKATAASASPDRTRAQDDEARSFFDRKGGM